MPGRLCPSRPEQGQKVRLLSPPRQLILAQPTTDEEADGQQRDIEPAPGTHRSRSRRHPPSTDRAEVMKMPKVTSTYKISSRVMYADCRPVETWRSPSCVRRRRHLDGVAGRVGRWWTSCTSFVRSALAGFGEPSRGVPAAHPAKPRPGGGESQGCPAPRPSRRGAGAWLRFRRARPGAKGCSRRLRSRTCASRARCRRRRAARTTQ